jgi:hypothetical protein
MHPVVTEVSGRLQFEDFIDGVVSEDDGLIRPDEEVFLLADD